VRCRPVTSSSLLTNLLAIAALTGVAFLLGFSPSASFLDWLGVVGIVVLLGFAAGWLTVARGLAAKLPEMGRLVLVPLVMLPFFGERAGVLAAHRGVTQAAI
jgi:ABC-2 type transport system permease protein